MSQQTKIRVYASLFLLAVSVDGLVYLVTGQGRMINWESAIHAGWVTTAILLFLFVAYGRDPRWQFLPLFLHGTVFALAFLNQFFSFSAVLNYNCMLFNLVLLSAYYFMSSGRESGSLS